MCRQTQHFLWWSSYRREKKGVWGVGVEGGGGQLFPFAKVQDLFKASTALSDALCLNSLPLSLGFPRSQGGWGRGVELVLPQSFHCFILHTKKGGKKCFHGSSADDTLCLESVIEKKK